MVVRVAVAFAAAAGGVLLAGAWVRGKARQASWLRQSGGIVLVVAAPVAVAVAPGIPTRAVVLAVLGVALAGVGILDDRLDLPRWVTPVAVLLAASVATAEGLRFHLVGVGPVDVVWTIVWLTVLTGAVVGLGNADGFTPAVGAAAALGMIALAGFEGQGAAAATAAALVGACVGFLAYNVRPASLYIGRGGSLFLGFTLAALALWVRPAIGDPDALLVPVLLLGVPLLDAFVVTTSRLRHRRRLTTRYRDHLAHRLVTLGMRPGQALATLVTLELLLGGVAVFVGRGVLSVAIGGAIGVVLLGLLGLAAARAPVSDDAAPGFSRRVWVIALAVVAFVVVATVPAALAALRVRNKVDDGREAAEAALSASRLGDTERAAELFAKAATIFRDVRDQIDTPLTIPALAIPGLGPNVDAARQLADIGTDLAESGRTITASVDPDQLEIVDGRVPLEQVALVEPKLEEARKILVDARDRIRKLDPGYLLGPVRTGIAKVQRELDKTARDAVHAAASARAAPSILGRDEPRHYFLAIQNPAELRGTGGLIGNWGILTAENGKVSVGPIQRLGALDYHEGDPVRTLHAPADYKRRYARYDPANQWHPVNVSPDWPTVGAVIADLFPQSGGMAVDGVIAVDPLGLQALLELTGPVTVEGWPDPVGADNVIDVTLRDAYATFQVDDADRKDFLGDVARAAVDRATTGALGKPARIGKILGKAAHEGHMSLWFADPEQQRVARVLGISGGVPRRRGDSLLVVDVNGAGNKLDYYLQRTIDYTATIEPSGKLRTARVHSDAHVKLTNAAPASGLPRAVSGPAEGSEAEFVAGQNRALVSVYTPLDASSATMNGQTVGLASDEELGRNVYSTSVDLMPGQTADLGIDLAGDVAMARDGWYDLTLVRQPTLRPDPVTVVLAPADGFEVVGVKGVPGLAVVDGVVRGTVQLDRTRTVRVRLAHTEGRGLWERLKDGP